MQEIIFPENFLIFFIALKLSTCGDTNFIQYGKFSFCLIHSDRFFESEWEGGYREAGNNCNKRRSCSRSPIGGQMVTMYWPLFQPFFRHEQSVAVRRSTGNDVSGHYFCHYMFLIIFSHHILKSRLSYGINPIGDLRTPMGWIPKPIF